MQRLHRSTLPLRILTLLPTSTNSPLGLGSPNSLPHERQRFFNFCGLEREAGTSSSVRPALRHLLQIVLLLDLLSFCTSAQSMYHWHCSPIAQYRVSVRLILGCGAGFLLWWSGPRHASFLLAW